MKAINYKEAKIINGSQKVLILIVCSAPLCWDKIEGGNCETIFSGKHSCPFAT
jgi:hypothetical protein